ncbi:mechanosensitive ion channel, partial [Xanthomonas citri pv. citri]|nr:mechanosensitive ion channel [Xanthomonas citri pv. citri]
IHIAIIIAVAIIARWLLRKGVDWTIHLMVSRSEKREATMPGRTRRILAEATGASIDRQNQRTATVGGLLSNVGVTIIIIVALLSGFSTIGFKITPILTSAGIVGVALAFGAQTLVKDVLAGLF